jgi:adenosylcobyric acid synthase
MGQTTGQDCARPMIDFGTHMDGAISKQGNVRGCYLHGLFGSDAYRKALLQSAGFSGGGDVSYMETVEKALDELAEEMERWLDVDGLLGMAD